MIGIAQQVVGYSGIDFYFLTMLNRQDGRNKFLNDIGKQLLDKRHWSFTELNIYIDIYQKQGRVFDFTTGF